MNLYEFTPRAGDIKTLVESSIHKDYLLPNSTEWPKCYFANGDQISIYEDGRVELELLQPGNMFHSAIAMRFNQWYVKGLIKEVHAE